MRSKTNRFLVPSLLVIAILVVTADAWLAFRSLKSIEESQYWVEHTWQVIDQVERVMGSAEDADSGARRYLLSGEEGYLEEYKTATRELGPELDRFQQLTQDNPTQQSRSRAMRSILVQRMASLEERIQEGQHGNRGMQQTLALLNSGRVEQEHLRSLASEMEIEE